jgi:hypothetical protein
MSAKGMGRWDGSIDSALCTIASRGILIENSPLAVAFRCGNPFHFNWKQIKGI